MSLSQAGKVLLDSGLLKDPSTCKQAAHERFVGHLDHKFQRSEPCGALAIEPLPGFASETSDGVTKLVSRQNLGNFSCYVSSASL